LVRTRPRSLLLPPTASPLAAERAAPRLLAGTQGPLAAQIISLKGILLAKDKERFWQETMRRLPNAGRGPGYEFDRRQAERALIQRRAAAARSAGATEGSVAVGTAARPAGSAGAAAGASAFGVSSGKDETIIEQLLRQMRAGRSSEAAGAPLDVTALGVGPGERAFMARLAGEQATGARLASSS
jgi:hypothetical protein